MDLRTALGLVEEMLYRGIYVVMPLLICMNVVLVLDKAAPGLGLLDKPSQRKRHRSNVPLVGGPAIFIAVSLSAVLLASHRPVAVFLTLGAVLVALGIADDRFDLPAWFRLLVQASVATLMLVFGDVQIGHLGNLFGFGPIELHGMFAAVFTVVCTIGVINSINMIDGVDGLAGSILLISFTAMAYLSLQADNAVGSRMLAIFNGALLGFLCFNARVFVKQARIFMGDSGSMLMGLILAWFLIAMSQGVVAPLDPASSSRVALSAVSAGWIFGLPLLDTVAVVLGRLQARRSPFAAGRDHLHHRLLDQGFSVNKTVSIMLGCHLLLVLVGLLGNLRPALEPFMFWGFVLLTCAHAIVTPRLVPGDPRPDV